MAKKTSPNTGESQFFMIPQDSTPSHLDGVHTVFGKITSGCEAITMLSESRLGKMTDRLFQLSSITPLLFLIRDMTTKAM